MVLYIQITKGHTVTALGDLNLLYNVYRVFLGGKELPWRAADH